MVKVHHVYIVPLLCSLMVNGDRDFALNCEIGSEGCQSCEFQVTPGCSCSREDYAFWIEKAFFEFEPALQSCGIEFAANGANYQVVMDCLNEDPLFSRLSNSCNTCFADITNCTIYKCPRDCASFQGSGDPDCRRCVNSLCGDEFQACAGFRSDTCSEDVCVLPSIIPGFPDMYLFACIGVFLVLFVSVLIKCCRSKLRIKELDEEDEDKFQAPASPIIEPIAGERPSSLAGSSSKSRRSKNSSSNKVRFLQEQPNRLSASPMMGTSRSSTRNDSVISIDFYDMDDFEEKPDI